MLRAAPPEGERCQAPVNDGEPRVFRFHATSQINAEKSYDSLPNFSAGDCLHCLGIGRNQYIELMNTSKSKGGLFYKSRKDPRLLLPDKPRAVRPPVPSMQSSIRPRKGLAMGGCVGHAL